MSLRNRCLLKNRIENSSPLRNLIRDKEAERNRKNTQKLRKMEMINTLIKMTNMKNTKGMTEIDKETGIGIGIGIETEIKNLTKIISKKPTMTLSLRKKPIEKRSSAPSLKE